MIYRYVSNAHRLDEHVVDTDIVIMSTEDIESDELFDQIIEVNPTFSESTRSNSSASISLQLPETTQKETQTDIGIREDILANPLHDVIRDDLTMFLLGLGSTMKNFDPVRLANVKLELATIVGRADIEHAREREIEREFRK